MKHLFVAISGHGLGHLAQVAPVLHELSQRTSGLRITVQSSAPADKIRDRIPQVTRILPVASDIALMMDGPLHIRAEQTVHVYTALHEHWQEAMDWQTQLLVDDLPDLVLSDVAYLPLAAAQVLNISNVGLSSLNWADLFEHYCSDFKAAGPIVEQIRSIYQQADAFLRCEPAMPMPALNQGNSKSIGPLMERGKNQRSEITKALKIPENSTLILVSPGGVDFNQPPLEWPHKEHIHWFAPAAWQHLGPQFHVPDQTSFSHRDLIASVDLLMMKPGYGMFAEAAAAGVPSLVFPRQHWPEEPYLFAWLKQYCPVLTLPQERLFCGDFIAPMEILLQGPRGTPCTLSGEQQAAEIILDLIS